LKIHKHFKSIFLWPEYAKIVIFFNRIKEYYPADKHGLLLQLILMLMTILFDRLMTVSFNYKEAPAGHFHVLPLPGLAAVVGLSIQLGLVTSPLYGGQSV